MHLLNKSLNAQQTNSTKDVIGLLD